MDDLISKQAAIEAVRSYYNECDEDERSIEERIESLPTAEPDMARAIATILENEQDMRVIKRNAEPRWIPVTERLPEAEKNILVSYHFNSDNEEFFPSLNGVTISWWSGVKNHGKLYFPELGDNYEVLAWMPMPTPWKGESDATD